MDLNLRDRIPRPQTEVFSVGQGKSWIYNALPGPLTSVYSLLAAGSITGLAYYFGDSMGGGKGYEWSLVVIAIMTFIGLIAFLVSARRAKRAAKAKAGGFESAVKGSTAGWETATGDVQEIARLDDLRAKFQTGIEIFNQHGKSLYELPWYVIVGEPSSGKSEAIRRSELRFPQGLQDKLQGVGGTHSMNWWFTNHAVILDTAGAMLMDPEAAQRFEEFMTLLRTHRTDYPINGLILTLPVDKLLTDPPHVAEEKARTIAAQLAIVQKALDVRFPLYVMVSKSDRLPGFREFVDAENQTTFEPQIFGWSNPAPLDEPFDSGRLDEALGCIADRLQRRVLCLIADPIARQQGVRRTDEVDSIYNFPQILRTLAPRLQCYLEVLFQTGTWASKPPFFRGLYFTSAMREGNELDQALAQALNMDVHKLPTGGLFTQEKAVFLRDLFLSKIFLEKGLVTRLKNVGALLRRRLVTFFVTTFSLVALLLLFAFIVRSKIQTQLDKEQADYWITANQSWNNGALLPLLARQDHSPRPPSWSWFEEKTKTRLDLVADMIERTDKPLNLSWVFRPIPEWRTFEERRRQAALIVFEGSLIKPLLDAARERMLWDTAPGADRTHEPETESRLAGAYEQLALLEAWVVNKDSASSSALRPPTDETRWTTFFESLLRYVLTPAEYESKKIDPGAIAKQAKALYTGDARGIDLRKRSWMAEHAPDINSSALASAARLLFGQTADKVALNDQQKAENQQAKQDRLHEFLKAEALLQSWSRDSLPHTRQDVEASGMTPMHEAEQSYKKLVAGGGASSTLDGTKIKHLAQITLDVIESTRYSQLQVFKDNAGLHLGKTAPAGPAANNLDAEWVAARTRLARYDTSFEAITAEKANLSTSGGLIGSLVAKLKEADDKASKMALASPGSPPKAAAAPAAATGTEDEVATYLGTFRGSGLVSRVFEKYLGELKAELSVKLLFPLVRDGGEYASPRELETTFVVLNRIEKDAADLDKESRFQSNEPVELKNIFAHLQSVFKIRNIFQGGGLQIQVAAMAKAEQVPIPQAIPVTPPLPNVYVPPPVPRMEASGIKNLTIVTNNFEQFNDAPSGAVTKVDWDGYSAVEVRITTARPGKEDNTSSEGFPRGWTLLRKFARGEPNSSARKLSVAIKPPNSFSNWPSRSDFGLR